jgi:hypothetical protein
MNISKQNQRCKRMLVTHRPQGVNLGPVQKLTRATQQLLSLFGTAGGYHGIRLRRLFENHLEKIRLLLNLSSIVGMSHVPTLQQVCLLSPRQPRTRRDRHVVKSKHTICTTQCHGTGLAPRNMQQEAYATGC